MENKRWIIKDLSDNGWVKEKIGVLLILDKDREEAHRFLSKNGAELFMEKIKKYLGGQYEVEQL